MAIFIFYTHRINMKVKRVNEVESTKAPSAYFTGTAFINALVKNENESNTILSVTFAPGSRNYWHAHPGGQVLICTYGKGYVQKRGEHIQEIFPGDVVTIDPGEVHWHGAAPDSIFTHIAVNPHIPGKEETEWLEEVTSAEYHSK